MRFRFVISRRVSRVLTYLVIICVVFFCFSLISDSQSSHAPGREDRVHLEEHQHLAFGVDPFVEYKSLPKKDWHDYEAMKKERKRTGFGEGGTAVIAPDDPKTKAEELALYKANGYNGYVSDMIDLHRSVKDIRHVQCKEKKYLSRLPVVSVILPFHDEHNSTLLRSAHSIIDRTPKELLKEIILVDDESTKPFLKEPLDEYWRNQHLEHIVKVVRTKKREGLIRARQVGANAAIGEILVFLDAHSEPNYNWLPPLIEPVALDYRTVVCPFVDVIDCDNFEYRAQDEGARGSFDWEFHYKRLPLTEDDLKHPTEPFKSPVMAGGYFAISRQWFTELGGYDEGLDIWGGEQYELSFKTWQCHGSLLDAPCSRVGHIYRCKYIPFPNPGVGDFLSRNYRRVAEVWMDDYKEHLYKRMPQLRNTDEGDLSKQKAIRKLLKCKSFDWFMKTIAFDQDKYYPAVEPPDSANGTLRNIAAKKCINSDLSPFGLEECEKKHGQLLRFSFWLDVRQLGSTQCFDVSTSVHRAPIVLFSCHGMQGNQHFKYYADKKSLFHPVSNLCLDCDVEAGSVFMSKCDATKETQQWEWSFLDVKLMNERNTENKIKK